MLLVCERLSRWRVGERFSVSSWAVACLLLYTLRVVGLATPSSTARCTRIRIGRRFAINDTESRPRLQSHSHHLFTFHSNQATDPQPHQFIYSSFNQSINSWSGLRQETR
ncbi:uncharacterized protein BDV14DRAFT_177936 [Aspergillus stella-maris]|uniref:uncharacterized protein n=1 Tax=Aspergillus stella-maris TaxID=1810926 RepID=UPI003CCDDFBF